MINTDKMLEEFDKMFPNLGATDPKEGWYDAKPEVKAFLTSKIYQVVSEEQVRVRGVIRNMPAITRSEAENENCVNMDDLLESLDKPLT